MAHIGGVQLGTAAAQRRRRGGEGGLLCVAEAENDDAAAVHVCCERARAHLCDCMRVTATMFVCMAARV